MYTTPECATPFFWADKQNHVFIIMIIIYIWSSLCYEVTTSLY